jgi:hypothetical protein
MSDRLARMLAQEQTPVRLYSPNPDAPQFAGAVPTADTPAPFSARLWNAIKNAPGQLWGMLPAEARHAYTSGFKTAVDMSTPASVRDYTASAQDTARSAMQGDGWGTATNALATVNAALGAVPVAGLGVTLARKGAQEAGEAIGKGAGKVIRAYHGSPHSFDKFDLSKIGTGEGAQAYGHGLYFAENEGVAKGYRDTLTKSGSEWGQRALDKAGGNVDAAIAALQEKINRYAAGGNQTYADAQAETLRALQQYKQTGQWSPGSMYEVAIKADPEKFLDWDKPLAQQHPDVRDAVNRVARSPEPYGLDKITDDMRGVELQKLLRSPGGTKALADAGVPGIRYLDQGSRFQPANLPNNPMANEARQFLEQAGGDVNKALQLFRDSNPAERYATTERDEIAKVIRSAANPETRNYVAFDDRLIEILRKYGFLPAAGAAGYAALPNDPAPEAR